MAQISKGHQYEPSGDKSQVTAENLNDHVDKATLLLGCIKEQDWSGGANNEDEILVAQGESLVRISKESFLRDISLQTGSIGFGGGQFQSNSSVNVTHGGFLSSYLNAGGGQNGVIFYAPAPSYNTAYGFGGSTTLA